MSNAGGKQALLTSAMIVAAIRLWLQLRGKAKTPFSEWVTGWGATFFVLALLSEVSPSAAGSLSLLIATSDFLVNAVNLTTDINSVVTGGETGSIFNMNPFSGGTANTGNSQSVRENSKPANVQTFKGANF